MKIAIATLLLLMSAVTSRAADTLLISDVTVISAERQAPLEGAYVLVDNGLITTVTTDPGEIEADVVIDGRGRYLTPGLIDSHVHLGSNGGMRADQARRNETLLNAFHKREPLNYLAFGFTTLIDVSSSQQFADRWNAQPLRPDLEFCIGVPFSNGYGMAFEPVESRFQTPYFLYDVAQADVIPDQYLPEDHTPEAVIKKVSETDAICVKSYYETGFGGLFDFPVPSHDLIETLVAEAHAAGLTVLMHGNSLEGQRFAVDTGVDVIAHGAWHWDDWNAERTVVKPVQLILDDVIGNDVAVQMTAQVIYGERDLLVGDFLKDPRLIELLPQSLLAWYGSEDGAWFQQQMQRNYIENASLVEKFIGHPPTGDVAEPTRAAIQRLSAAGTYLAERRATFLFGTDTPSSPTYTNPPGYNGLLEIGALGELGLDSRQIFEALTVNNARAFGIDSSVGSIEIGKKANLLLLNANPLENTSAWDTIDVVILGGRVLPRQSLFRGAR